jgi:hypothetical protein
MSAFGGKADICRTATINASLGGVLTNFVGAEGLRNVPLATLDHRWPGQFRISRYLPALRTN